MKLQRFGKFRLKFDTARVQCAGIDPYTTRSLGGHFVTSLVIVRVRTLTPPAHRELGNNPSALRGWCAGRDPRTRTHILGPSLVDTHRATRTCPIKHRETSYITQNHT